MKQYRIKLSNPSDKFLAPWDVIVRPTGDHEHLIVQPRHPMSGCILIGFEDEPYSMVVTVLDENWPTQCKGMSMVMIEDGDMLSIPGLVVDEVIEEAV